MDKRTWEQMNGTTATWREEFRLKFFGYSHSKPNLFVDSQWCLPDWVFFIWRLFWLIYMVVWFVKMMLTSGLIWMKYLTCWSYGLLILDALLAIIAITSVKIRSKCAKHGSGDVSPSMPWYLKCYWMVHNGAINMGLMVTLLYWTCEYGGGPISAANANIHIINSVYIVLDVYVSATPLRLLHFYAGSLFGLIYMVFSIVHQAQHDNKPIYSILDWNKPLPTAILSLSMCSVVMFVLWFFLYVLFRTRLCMYSYCIKKRHIELVQGTEDDSMKSCDSLTSITDTTAEGLMV